MNQNHGCKVFHLRCPTFMGGFYPEPWFGSCLELFKTEALYKSNKAGGIPLP